jgi:ribose/xylose/arabinose/galactoside ABC-type transport system permease subunit
MKILIDISLFCMFICFVVTLVRFTKYSIYKHDAFAQASDYFNKTKRKFHIATPIIWYIIFTVLFCVLNKLNK